jgi:tetraacyldisaccharide 4'-kinase
MSVQSWVNDLWYARRSPPWWLRPLAGLYGAAAACRGRLYAHHWRQAIGLPVPVIVVGNLTVGGTGKTPLVCWLVARLAEIGLRPGVVTRGYGGSSRSPRLVQPGDAPSVVGDEPLLLARRTGVPVAAGRDRPAASRLLVDAGCDVIVSDDGLQHHALARDCELIVVDGERGFGNGGLLPAGPLRERPARLRSAQAVVINGGPREAGAAVQGLAGRAEVAAGGGAAGDALLARTFGMRMVGTVAVALVGAAVRPLSEFAGQSVHAVAGIGHPQRFFRMLRRCGIEVAARALPDHAQLARRDIDFPDERAVLMTEKDAVKCAGLADARHWYVPVHAQFDVKDAAMLMGIVTRAITRAPARGVVGG